MGTLLPQSVAVDASGHKGISGVIRCLEDLKKAIRDILQGLEFLHKNGFVHRDVRWANIIRDEAGTFRLK